MAFHATPNIAPVLLFAVSNRGRRPVPEDQERPKLWKAQSEFVALLRNAAEELAKQVMPGARLYFGLIAVPLESDGELYSEPPLRDSSKIVPAVEETLKRWREMPPDPPKSLPKKAAFLGRGLEEDIKKYGAEGTEFYFRHVRQSGYQVVLYCAVMGYTEGQLRLLKSTDLFSPPGSLAEAAISEFMTDAMNALQVSLQRNAKHYDARLLRPEEVIRRAGHTLMDWPVFGCEGDFWDLTESSLFEAMTSMTSMSYENAPPVGTLLFCAGGHRAVHEVVVFEAPVPIGDERRLRKLLETTRGELCLIADSRVVRGLGRQVATYAGVNQDLFEVRISGRGHWQLCHAEQPLMDVVHGQPSVPQDSFGLTEFSVAVRRVFPDLNSKGIIRLWNLVAAAIAQKHGTTLVISCHARDEAGRLARQAVAVKPFDLDEELMMSLSSVDGAVLIDLSGICHAFGVILDGRVSEGETPTRGARYNSAVRYVETDRAEDGSYMSCAIVVSEDGTVDFLPQEPVEDEVEEDDE